MEIAGGMMEFCQEGNSCDGGIELLRVHVKDAGAGKFLILETEQWATSIEELVALLKRVEAGFEINQARDSVEKGEGE